MRNRDEKKAKKPRKSATDRRPRDRQVYSTRELPPALRTAILEARPSEEAAAFDDEVPKNK